MRILKKPLKFYKVNFHVLKIQPFLILIIALTMFACNKESEQTAYPGGIWEPAATEHGSTGLQDTTMQMSDGVTLQASVSYPANSATGEQAEGQFPVIIEITPYPQLRSLLSPISYLNEHGYIYVVARPRGTGGSEGELQQFTSLDGRDGKEIVDWAAHELEGSDGRIGLHGCSYPGATALATAAAVERDSPVKAVLAACIGLEMQHRQVWTTNGLPNAALSAYVPNAKAIMGDLPSVREYWENYHESFMSGGPEAYDGYWEDRLPLKWAQNIAQNDIPILLWTGWQDINEIGAVHAYTALQNAANGRPVYEPMTKNISVSPRYQLIMGNWGHAQGLHPGIYLQWFETWLKGVDTGIQNTSTPMHLFETGTDKWINVDRYPLVQEYTRWYFTSDRALESTETGNNGELSLAWAAPETEEGKVSFETPAIDNGATLAGPMSVTVNASSSNTNMVLIAKLFDIAPDGTSERITYGALLGSQSELDEDWSWTDENDTMIWPWPKLEEDIYLTPDQIYQFEIPLAARQWAVLPGHHLRLELTTQSPQDVCPDEGPVSLTSEPCWLTKPQQETIPGGIYTIHYGPDYPSAINLPQLPFNTFEGVRSGLLPAEWTDDEEQADQSTRFTLPLEW